METLIDKKDLKKFQEFFGNKLVLKNYLWCDITQSEKARVEIIISYRGTLGDIVQDIFWKGVMIGKELQY
jgi:hypothetical protein